MVVIKLLLVLAQGSQNSKEAPKLPLDPPYTAVILGGSAKLTEKQKAALTGSKEELSKSFDKARKFESADVRVFYLPDPGTEQLLAHTSALFKAGVDGKFGKEPFRPSEIKDGGALNKFLCIVGLPEQGSPKVAVSVERMLTFSHGGKDIKIPYWKRDENAPQTKLTKADEIDQTESLRTRRPELNTMYLRPESGFNVMVAGEVAVNRHPRIVQWAFKLLDEAAQKDALERQKLMQNFSKSVTTMTDPNDLKGKRLSDFGPDLKKTMMERLASNFSKDGFKSEEEATAFWNNAQIGGVSDMISVVWRVTEKNQPKNMVGYVGYVFGSVPYSP